MKSQLNDLESQMDKKKKRSGTGKSSKAQIHTQEQEHAFLPLTCEISCCS